MDNIWNSYSSAALIATLHCSPAPPWMLVFPTASPRIIFCNIYIEENEGTEITGCFTLNTKTETKSCVLCVVYLTNNLSPVTLTSHSKPSKIHYSLFNGKSRFVYIKPARNKYVTLKLPFIYLPFFSLKWQHPCICHIVKIWPLILGVIALPEVICPSD